MTHIVQFSGGKDSTALVLWAREHLPEFTSVFCDTGWEHPLTYEYVQYINATVLGGKLVTVASTKYPGGMVELVTRKHRVPSTRARFCTEELKVFPFRDWLRSQTFIDEWTVYQGIRADESGPRRAAGSRLWSDVYDCWVERPLFDWSSEQVFDLHRKHGVDPNPLYKAGASRVGCYPCIMVNHGELKRMGAGGSSGSGRLIWERADNLERAANRSFFPPKYIPERFCSHHDESSNTWYPSVSDVEKYIEGADKNQIRLWDACPMSGCMSVYNLCE